MMPNPNECPECGGDMVEKGDAFVCGKCLNVKLKDKPVTAAPTPTSAAAPAVVDRPDTKNLAEAVANKVTELRNELIWKDLQSPGVVIQLVDGGYLIENRWGQLAVRADIQAALVKVQEWLTPK